jgi:Endonuclease/Exonuclease/phosphatase family
MIRSVSVRAGVVLFALLSVAGGPGERVREPRFSGPVELDGPLEAPPGTVRFATFNASLNRNVDGQLIVDLSTPANAQAAAVAEVIQRVHPDVLLINEFDFDAQGEALRLFRENYLEVSQGGQAPVRYEFGFVAPSNTGVFSGLDLDNNGAAQPGNGNDAFGFGAFPGQFGMAVLSKFPIASRVRTFQTFLWKDMPGALLPVDPSTGGGWYSPAELEVFRLSSKSHWDLPIRIDREVVHLLVSHPTPPVFDGAEDRNGRRNYDEIRFWSDYVGPRDGARYIYDDRGRRGGLGDEPFVIMGDLNSDPFDGDSIPGSAQLLLDHPAVDASVIPISAGAGAESLLQGIDNLAQENDAFTDTADFGEAPFGPGNLRVDYVLPSRQGLSPVAGGVFWPRRSDESFSLTGVFPFPTSDHRLVWMDLKVN